MGSYRWLFSLWLFCKLVQLLGLLFASWSRHILRVCTANLGCKGRAFPVVNKNNGKFVEKMYTFFPYHCCFAWPNRSVFLWPWLRQ